MPVASFGCPGTVEMPEGKVLLMRIDLDEALEPPSWPAGVSVRAFRAEDARAVHDLLEVAFAGGPETIMPFDEWLPWMTLDVQFDPTAWFLAEEAGELVGAVLAWNDGFVKDLAVHPDARRRGLGEALLRHVFLEFSRRGVDSVSLKVLGANRTAVRLYERVGMA